MLFSKTSLLALFYKVFGPQSAIKHQRNSFFEIKPTVFQQFGAKTHKQAKQINKQIKQAK